MKWTRRSIKEWSTGRSSPGAGSPPLPARKRIRAAGSHRAEAARVSCSAVAHANQRKKTASGSTGAGGHWQGPCASLRRGRSGLWPGATSRHHAGATPGDGLLVQRKVGAPRRRAAAAGPRAGHRRGALAPRLCWRRESWRWVFFARERGTEGKRKRRWGDFFDCELKRCGQPEVSRSAT
jgi:hypothetical protein